jgi:ribosomal protein S18 acetylase RimI-like enzyme
MAIALGHLTGTGARTVRLEADPAGIRIYRKIGFVDEFPSCRFRREVATSDGRDNSSARPLPAAGLPRVAGFDRNAFGDDRGRLIELLHRRAEAAYLVQRRDCITGYALLMPTVQGVHFGPAVADSPDVARQLLEAALRQAEGRTMSLGIPAPNEEGIALVRSLGFTETPSSLRMVRPAPICAGRPTHVFGIASGAFG